MCRLVVGSSNASCIGLGNVGRRDELRACCGGGGAWEEALGAAVVAASDAAELLPEILKRYLAWVEHEECWVELEECSPPPGKKAPPSAPCLSPCAA